MEHAISRELTSLDSIQPAKKAAELTSYLPVPIPRSAEFWTRWKINHIRSLAQTGKAGREIFLPDSERTSRVLDRLKLRTRESGDKRNESVSTEVRFSRDSDVVLSAPLYLGDMSFGALSGVPNIAIARAADATGIMAGTGEGGLQREVSECSRITVQWASARFGVDMGTLAAGQAVVIKIGQGAKPGIGGHLPGVKVTRPISETRRIPVGRDAISPAPHHDIYSIEDLGQRIAALKEATKKPVFVKVGATNYIPYIASGVARMGASGIIVDGAGAGTGAAPTVIKNNIGIPIELAVASVDSILKREKLREGFTVIAAGRVSAPEDSLKLIALGADITSLGTAALIALGCLMVHKCHLGFCPAVLTNKISENQAKVLSLDQSVQWLTNIVKGWTEELRELLDLCGISNIGDARGNRDLLIEDGSLNYETLKILGLREESRSPSSELPELIHDLWPANRITMLREMAGSIGKTPAEAVISSMGSTSAPFVEKPARILDFIVSDGAQVTRPSIDPYREEIEIFTIISGLRLSAPFFFTHLPSSIPVPVRNVFARVSASMGLLLDTLDSPPEFYFPYASRLISNEKSDSNNVNIAGCPKPLLRLSCSEKMIGAVDEAHPNDLIAGYILDEALGDSDISLEIAVAKLDEILKNRGSRYELSILAESDDIRGSDDIFKLLALGADCVGFGKAALLAIGFEEGDKEIIFESGKSILHLENFVVALQREIKLLAGAAGISSLSSSLVGNHELLRSVDLAPELRCKLGVKPSGSS